jgi:hypothetical protein
MENRDLRIRIMGDSSSLESATARSQASIGRLQNSIRTIGQNLSRALKVGGLIGAGLGAGMIKLASDYEESMNKVNVSLKENSQSAKDFAKTTLNSFGIAEGSALEMIALFSDMGTGMGLTTKEMSTMSTELTGLAGDLASFKNISIDVAQTALNSVFSGETEALKKLGIVMTVANLEAFALKEGIKKTYNEMSQAEKVSLRFKFVMDASKNSVGDFARTSDSTSNQLRSFKEGIKELGANIGEALLPATAEIVKKINEFMKTLKDNGAIDRFKEKISKLSNGLIDLTDNTDGSVDSLMLLTKTLGMLYIADKIGALQLLGNAFRSAGAEANIASGVFLNFSNLQRDGFTSRSMVRTSETLSNSLRSLTDEMQILSWETQIFHDMGDNLNFQRGVSELERLRDSARSTADELVLVNQALSGRLNSRGELIDTLQESTDNANWFARSLVDTRLAMDRARGGYDNLAVGSASAVSSFAVARAGAVGFLGSIRASLMNAGRAMTGFIASWGGVIAVVIAVAVAVVGAIVAIIQAIQELWRTNEKFREEVMYIYETLKPLAGAMAEVSLGLWTALKTIWSAIVGFFGEFVLYITHTVASLIANIQGIKDGFKQTFDGIMIIWETFKALFSGDIDTFGKLLYKGFSTAFSGIDKIAQNAMDGMLRILTGAIDLAITGMNGLIEGTNRVIKTDFEKIPLLGDQFSKTKYGTEVNKPDVNPNNTDFVKKMQGLTGKMIPKNMKDSLGGKTTQNPKTLAETLAGLYNDKPLSFEDAIKKIQGMYNPFKGSKGGSLDATADPEWWEKLNKQAEKDDTPVEENTNAIDSMTEQIKEQIKVYKLTIGEFFKNKEIFAQSLSGMRTQETYSYAGKQYSAGSGINIQNMTVRNDNDIKEIARELATLQKRDERRFGNV